MAFGSLGGWEWVVIFAIAIMIFGLGRVPKAMADLGKSIKEFRKAASSDDETP